MIINSTSTRWAWIAALFVGYGLLIGSAALPRLQLSENHRFLVKADGSPFFYLGDTAWELFHRLDAEDAERYLKNRAEKRFTVIQAVVLAELNGIREPNAKGEKPFMDDVDPTHPNEAYFKHVDWIVKTANELGLYIGMLPTWGDKVGKTGGAGPSVFTPENARIYGEFLGKRYRDAGIIWILGGDRPADDDQKLAIWKALAAGLKSGDEGHHLVTYHPPGGGGEGSSSSKWFHREEWLDFNMRQNGHCDETPTYDWITRDYARTPAKPVLDGEPLYEDHPICFNAAKKGHSNADDIRRWAYWDVFAGAFGHTYGNHCIWQMHSEDRGNGINGPLLTWDKALDQPGAAQMKHLRALVESRPFLTRIPDQSLVLANLVKTENPGNGQKRIQATRDQMGSYAFFYVPASRAFTVDLSKLSGEELKAWWFNPRDGSSTPIETFPREGKRSFSPPDAGENVDWVLVLDDIAKNYGVPGTRHNRE